MICMLGFETSLNPKPYVPNPKGCVWIGCRVGGVWLSGVQHLLTMSGEEKAGQQRDLGFIIGCTYSLHCSCFLGLPYRVLSIKLVKPNNKLNGDYR